MFSELIDSVCAEVSRVDLKSHSVSWLNQTIRECHIDPERNSAVFLWPNYREAQVVADVDSAFAWEIPNTRIFQGVQMVRFDSVKLDGNPVFAEELIQGRVGNSQSYAFQRAGDRILFKGYGGTNGVISIAYFEFPRGLKYYTEATRPAVLNVETDEWTYHADYSSTDELRLTARGLVTNWLLERWEDTLKEGLRAKIYKRLGDDVRARTCYSLYMQSRLGLQNSELADLTGMR